MKVSGDVVKPQAIEDKHYAYITSNGFYGTQWQSAGNQPGTKPLNHNDIPDYKTIVSPVITNSEKRELEHWRSRIASGRFRTRCCMKCEKRDNWTRIPTLGSRLT